MVEHFSNYSNWVKKFFPNKINKLLEVGSNDGTFLSNFNDEIETIGFEPSLNVSNLAKQKKINSINEFFDIQTVKNFKNYKNQIDVITAANVICHIPNLKNLFQAVDFCLSKKGIFVFEEPYLGSMFEKFLMINYMMNIFICYLC